MNTPFYSIPEPPETTTPTQIITRLVDGLGFRYHWATEGLRESDYSFRPCDTSQSLKEVLLHIYQLSCLANRVFRGSHPVKTTFEDNSILREETLAQYKALRLRLQSMDEDELTQCNFSTAQNNYDFPFWYLINGPLADALTHVGQITSWRRIAGNPQAKGVNVFLGKKINSSK